jgi:hypothetical protein
MSAEYLNRCFENRKTEGLTVELVAEGEADIAAGRTQPARKVFRSLAKRKARTTKKPR